MCTQRGREGAGEGRSRRAEVCPLADGQSVVGRLTGHSDLCLGLQRALSLFIHPLKETAGAPPTLRTSLGEIVMRKM